MDAVHPRPWKDMGLNKFRDLAAAKTSRFFHFGKVS